MQFGILSVETVVVEKQLLMAGHHSYMVVIKPPSELVGLHRSVILQVFFFNNFSLLEKKQPTQKCALPVQCIQSSVLLCQQGLTFQARSLLWCGSLWHMGDNHLVSQIVPTQLLWISTCYQQSGKSLPLKINTHFTRA